MDRIRKVIYIAGPMAKGPMEENIRMAWGAASRLRDARFSTIVPQNSFFETLAGESRSHEEWLDIDRALVLKSDGLLRLPGESKGADIEARWAKEAGIPVFSSVRHVEDHDWDVCVVRSER